MNKQIEQFTKRADEFDKGQLVIGRAELDIILNDYISKEDVEKLETYQVSTIPELLGKELIDKNKLT